MEVTEALAWKIHKAYYFDGVGQHFFAKFLAEIKALGKTDFLAASLKNFIARYNFELMLCLPSLWEHFTIADWVLLMEKVGDRPAQFKPMDDLGIFADIQFICRCLEIDGLDIYLSTDRFSDKNKLAVLQYMRVQTSLFICDDFERQFREESYQEGYLACGLEKLSEIKHLLLLNNPTIKEFPQNEETANKYINQRLQDFENSLLNQ